MGSLISFPINKIIRSRLQDELDEAITKGTLRDVELILKRGVNIKSILLAEGTALASACVSGEVMKTRLLIEYGADVNEKLDADVSMLHYSLCDRGRKCHRIVKLLLDHGVEIDATDGSGWTALMYAANNLDEASVRVLLERGADSRLKNENGETALDVVERYAYPSDYDVSSRSIIKKMLIASGCKAKSEKPIRFLVRFAVEEKPLDRRNRDEKSQN